MKLKLLLLATVGIVILFVAGPQVNFNKITRASNMYTVNIPLVSNPLTIANATWAFEEYFDQDPAAPSQALCLEILATRLPIAPAHLITSTNFRPTRQTMPPIAQGRILAPLRCHSIPCEPHI
ncbi:MAG: hypothetical protein IPJ90_08320 [Anaerolineaceae bacterium]|nr:hypothetical protein [Anaerolineaceae bacterium]